MTASSERGFSGSKNRNSRNTSIFSWGRLFSVVFSIIAMLFLLFTFHRWLNHPLISQTVGASTVLSRSLLFPIIAVLSALSLMVSISISHSLARLDWSRILANEQDSMQRLLYKVSSTIHEGRWDVKNRYWSLRAGYSRLFLWKPILVLSAGLACLLILCLTANSLPGLLHLVSGDYEPTAVDHLFKAVDEGLNELFKGIIENFIRRIDLIIGG